MASSAKVNAYQRRASDDNSNDRFHVWSGVDVWHQECAAQVRLEESGDVFVSADDGASALQVEMPFPEFAKLLREMIKSKLNAPK